MISPVPFLVDSRREELASQLGGLLKQRKGFVELALFECDEAEVVVALGVAIETVDEQPEDGIRPVVLASFVEPGSMFLRIRGDVPALKGEAPVEGVVRIPLALLLVAELEPPVDQVGQVLELGDAVPG